ncbi:hypothetical protein ABZ502_17160 [Streptomyces abikoensis]|uniref:hypothetical protein n=1 Tax=Streptomyces abikoensis TaxID=97398 RepID=UPI0033E57F5E
MDHGWLSRFRTASDLDTAGLPARLATLAFKALLFYGVVWGAAQYATRTGLFATIHRPVTAYLRDNAVGLPMTAQDLIDLWALVGIGGFLVVAVLRSRSARLVWLAWGLVTTAMVWAGTAQPGRPIATGVTVVAWACASLIALRGRG